MVLQEIAVAALIASSAVTTPPFEKQLLGGELGLVATRMCVEDGRDLSQKFTLIKEFKNGTFNIRCQTLEATNGLYYASKGIYTKERPMFIELIRLFKEARK